MIDTGPRYTPKERWIRILMGASILVIGLYSALGLGLANIFSEDGSTRGVSQFLIVFGLAFCQVGAGFVCLYSGNKGWLGQALFCICFVVSALIILIGLRHIFGDPPVGIFLMLVGFASSAISAFAMR